MPMSEKFKEVEEKKAAEEKAAADQEIKDKTVVFLSKASDLRLGNWKLEKKASDGSIISREQSIKFRNHVHVTDNPEEIEFIKNHHGFLSGSCEIVSSVEEATRIAKHRKRLKEGLSLSESALVETDDISDKTEIRPLMGAEN